MGKLNPFICLLIAVVLYLFAPAKYNLAFCTGCCCLYGFIAYTCILEDVKKKNYLSFNLIYFAITFVVTFIIPVWIYYFDEFTIYLRYDYSIYDKYVCRGTAMSTLAVAVYSLAWHKQISKATTVVENSLCHNVFIPNSLVRVLNVCAAGATLYYAFGLLIFFQTHSSSFELDSSYYTSFVYTFLPLTLLVSAIRDKSDQKSIKNFFLNNKFICSCFIFIIFAALYIGDRTIPLYLIIAAFSTYHFFYKKVRLTLVITGAIIGFALIYTVGRTRQMDNSFKGSSVSDIFSTTSQTVGGAESVFEFFIDLYPSTEALYLFERWRDNTGELFYPFRIICIAANPIPLGPKLLAQLIYDKQIYDLNSGTLSTNQYQSYVTSINGGIGTNAVGDIYVSWGIIGVLIFFYLFGYLIGKSQRKYNFSIYWALFYIAFISDAVYLPRSTLFDPYRAIAWQFIALWLIKLFNYKNQVRQIIK